MRLGWKRSVKRAFAPSYARMKRARPSGGAAILCYHGAGSASDRIEPVRLRDHLVYIAETFKVVPLTTMIDELRLGVERRADDLRVALTFDDAYRSILNPVEAALSEVKFDATAFLVTGLIGTAADWQERVPLAERRMFDLQDVEYWLALGMKIGSHTHMHRDLTKLPMDEAERDLHSSRHVIEQLSDGPVGLSYPWGRYGKREIDIARRLGFDFAVTTRSGTHQRPDRLFELRRIMMERDDDLRDVELKIRGGYDWTGMVPS